MIIRILLVVITLFIQIYSQEFLIYSTPLPGQYATDRIAKKIYFNDFATQRNVELFIPTREIRPADIEYDNAIKFFNISHKCVYTKLNAIRIRDLSAGTDSLLVRFNPEAPGSNTYLYSYFYISRNDKYLIYSINDSLNVFNLITGAKYRRYFNLGTMNIRPVTGELEEEIVFQVTENNRIKLIRYNFISNRMDTLLPEMNLTRTTRNEYNIFSINPENRAIYYLEWQQGPLLNLRKRSLVTDTDTVLFSVNDTFFFTAGRASLFTSLSAKKILIVFEGFSSFCFAGLYNDVTGQLWRLDGIHGFAKYEWNWLNEDTLLFMRLSPDVGYFGYDLREIVSVRTEKEKINNDLISVYPNPFNYSPTIEISSALSGRLKVELFSLLGEKLYVDEFETSGQEIEKIKFEERFVAGLPQGVYFLRIQLLSTTNTKRYQTYKLMKRKQ